VRNIINGRAKVRKQDDHSRSERDFHQVDHAPVPAS
jgi:hypothetical protein